MADSIDLKRVRHLVLLGEELHFSRAAERANLSQTAFSRSIQSLETDLGVRLFDRDTRSVMLTAAGRQLLARARELLSCAGRLTSEANHIANAEGGELRFGAGMMAANLFIRGPLTELRRSIPRLALKVEVNHWHHLMHHLEQEQIEFFVAYTSERISDPRYSITPLPSQPGGIFCRRDHPLARQKTPIPRRQLADHPWSSVISDASMPARVLAAIGLPSDTPVPASLTCNDLSLLRDTTLDSDALLLTWRAWLEDDLQAGRLVDLGPRLRPELTPDMFRIDSAIVRHAGRTLSPIAARAVELIIASAEAQARRY